MKDNRCIRSIVYLDFDIKNKNNKSIRIKVHCQTYCYHCDRCDIPKRILKDIKIKWKRLRYGSGKEIVESFLV